MTLTKADLVGQLIGQSGLDRIDAKQLVNQMLEEIRGSLENGEAANECAPANPIIHCRCNRPANAIA